MAWSRNRRTCQRRMLRQRSLRTQTGTSSSWSNRTSASAGGGSKSQFVFGDPVMEVPHQGRLNLAAPPNEVARTLNMETANLVIICL